jgi:hypothetical protein
MKPDHLKVNLEMKLAFISLLVLLAGCAADKQNTGLKWASPGNVYSAYLQEAPGDTGSQSLNLVVESRDKHAILFSLPLQRHAKGQTGEVECHAAEQGPSIDGRRR